MRKNRPMDDRTLVEACINKNLDSWSLLISKYSGLVNIAADCRLKKYGFTLPKEDIEDLRQNVFTAIWQEGKLKNVAHLDNISHWIAMVAGNMAINYVRKSSNRDALKAVPIDGKFKGKDLAGLLPSRPLRAEDDTSEAELGRKIDSAIRRLPCREKLIIKLHLFHGKKYEDIAEILNLPNGTVSSYVKRAKEKLKVALKDFK